MKNSELIATFLNNVVSGDAEAAKAAFSAYCNHKAKTIGNSTKIMERVEQFKSTLLEFGNDEVPLRLEGDKVLVNNKPVGRIQYDMDDFDGGINFISDDGKFSKEFHSAEDLFSYLSQQFLGDGNVK
jgi:hypothetical protein